MRKGFLDELARGSCKTLVMSSHVVASGSASWGSPSLAKPSTSRPLALTRFNDEVIAVQKAIDEFKAQGVRHIVARTMVLIPDAGAAATLKTYSDQVAAGKANALEDALANHLDLAR